MQTALGRDGRTDGRTDRDQPEEREYIYIYIYIYIINILLLIKIYYYLIYLLSCSHRYEGAFHRGKREGVGKYSYANGDSYEGYFKVGPPSLPPSLHPSTSLTALPPTGRQEVRARNRALLHRARVHRTF